MWYNNSMSSEHPIAGTATDTIRALRPEELEALAQIVELGAVNPDDDPGTARLIEGERLSSYPVGAISPALGALSSVELPGGAMRPEVSPEENPFDTHVSNINMIRVRSGLVPLPREAFTPSGGVRYQYRGLVDKRAAPAPPDSSQTKAS